MIPKIELVDLLVLGITEHLEIRARSFGSGRKKENLKRYLIEEESHFRAILQDNYDVVMGRVKYILILE